MDKIFKMKRNMDKQNCDLREFSLCKKCILLGTYSRIPYKAILQVHKSSFFYACCYMQYEFPFEIFDIYLKTQKGLKLQDNLLLSTRWSCIYENEKFIPSMFTQAKGILLVHKLCSCFLKT
uniref:Uncharacterized protein n=1 Tax=Cacopsylla melanoneura TaxID=428564 RepID=A0A8D8RPQ0_9HEMI